MTAIPIGRQPSELYKTLYLKMPAFRSTYGSAYTLNGRMISEKLGVSYQRVYIWLRKNRLPRVRAQQMVDISGGSLTMEDLKPFLSRR